MHKVVSSTVQRVATAPSAVPCSRDMLDRKMASTVDFPRFKLLRRRIRMGDAAKKYELQKIDLAWVRVARRLKALMEQLGETEAVREARAQVSATESTLQTWRGKQLDAELEAKQLAQKIAETEARLMSGTVNDHRDLENLQNSLEALRRHQALVDGSALEA